MSDLRTSASLLAYVGPVHEAFVNDWRFISAIMGPFGSAKTTGCIRKIFQSALNQKPQHDGWRRVRWCVVRDTYSQLETNVMKSWFAWFEKTKANWNGRMLQHVVRREVVFANGAPPIKVEIEMLFRAMGDQKAEDVLKGLELTGLWLNETDTLDRSVLLFGLPRVGRYPAVKDGGVSWSGIICDFNAPDVDNWTYDLLVEQNTGLTKEQEAELAEKVGPNWGIGFHRQPGGMSKDPLPENIENLETGYYERMMLGFAGDENKIRRFIHNEFGAVRNGQPVYPEFNDIVHVAKGHLNPDPDLPILAGLDGGRTPAMVFGQLDEDAGQLRILRDLLLYDPVNQSDLKRLGPSAFGEIASEMVAQWWPDCRMGVVFYDPAIDFGSEDDGIDWLRDFKSKFPAPRFSPGGDAGNRIDPRLEAVRRRLTNLPGGRPALLIDPRCRIVRRAFNNGYIFERIEHKQSGTGRFRSVPLKNDFSHPMDALAELCLGIQNRGTILNAMRRDAHDRALSRGKVDYGDGYFSGAAAGAI